jgi:hypothetical protein
VAGGPGVELDEQRLALHLDVARQALVAAQHQQVVDRQRALAPPAIA